MEHLKDKKGVICRIDKGNQAPNILFEIRNPSVIPIPITRQGCLASKEIIHKSNNAKNALVVIPVRASVVTNIKMYSIPKNH